MTLSDAVGAINKTHKKHKRIIWEMSDPTHPQPLADLLMNTLCQTDVNLSSILGELRYQGEPCPSKTSEGRL